MKQLIKIILLLLPALQSAGQNNYYFPKASALDASIPSPEKFLGYAIGSHYTRHEQIVAYFRELARVSNRIHVQTIGKTYEEREQIIATITSPDNYNNLESIRQEHLTLVDPAKPLIDSKAPVIIHLGYNVHGNESSSAEVSLLTAYYLVAAANDTEVQKWLKEAVIFIDPSLNPDGRDRAANWYNSYKSFPPVADPLDKEHVEIWPGGRTNHYFADLNRDWLNLIHVESRNRVQFFHQWYPNVQIDFHEQGSNATYYFEPTPKRHESPIIPQFLYDANATLATYHAKALDEIGSLYFTKENYDNLSPIYGSTYPKFYGSVAATFEEASSRGLVTETVNGPLTFTFSIRNHLTTSLSTIKGAVTEKTTLFKVQKDLFKYALEQAKANKTKAYVFGDSRDENLTRKFLNLLLQHHINVYEVDASITLEGKKFEKRKSYIVPAEQPNFLIIHSLFETNQLKDSIYYDNTGWSVIHAYGLQYAGINTSAFSKGKQVTALPEAKGQVDGGPSSLAYITAFTDYNSTQALFTLLQKGVLVKTSFKPFTVNTGSNQKKFGYGSLVIPVAAQSIKQDSLYKLLQDVAESSNVTFTSVNTGFSSEGIDLGSSNIKAVRKPEVALAFGQGVTSSEAGQIWFLLNQQLGLPVVKLDLQQFERALLKRYNTIILPGGSYNTWNKTTIDKIKDWVNEGGVLITLQNASAWAIQNEIAKEKVLTDDQTPKPNPAPGANTKPADNNTARPVQTSLGQSGSEKTEPVASSDNKNTRLDYDQQQDTEGAKRINGAIFTADLDTTNPIAFGVTTRKLYINKNSNTFLQASSNKYSTVALYDAKPFVNGYASKENIKKVSNSAAVLLSQTGAGQVVLFADDPTYRSYWLGTNRLFLNSIFFAYLTATQRFFATEEEEENK